MSKEEEVNQLSAVLDEAKEKIEFVIEKGGKYQRAQRTYQKARDSLASNDLRRCAYFSKRSLEQIEREYEKLSAMEVEPEKEENPEEPEAIQDDGTDMSWDEEQEEDDSSSDDVGIDLPPPPPDMIENVEEPGNIDEGGEEFFDLSEPVKEKPDEKSDKVKSTLREEESNELFDFGEEEETEVPHRPEKRPDPAPEAEAEELFDFEEADERKYSGEHEERPEPAPEEEAEELFDFDEAEERKYPGEPEKSSKSTPKEEVEDLFDFDEAGENEYTREAEERSADTPGEEESGELFDFGEGQPESPWEPKESPEPSPEEEAEALFDFEEEAEESEDPGEPHGPDNIPEPVPEEEENHEVFDYEEQKDDESGVELDNREPSRRGTDFDIDPDLDGIEIVGESMAPPDIEEEGDEEEKDTMDAVPQDWEDRDDDEEEEEDFRGKGFNIGWDEEDEGAETGEDNKLSEEITALQKAIESAPSFMNLSEVKELLGVAESKHRAREHSAAWEAIEKCKNDLDVLRKEYKKASERFEEAKEMLKKANELGVNIGPARDLLKQAKEHLNSGEIRDMGRLSDRCIEELSEEMIEPLTREKMLGLKTKILEYKNAGVNIKSAAEVFNTAGILMKERNFKQVMELATKSEAMADKSKTEFDLDNLLDAMKNGFEQLKDKDESFEEIGKDIERARELQNDGELEKAHDLAVETEKNLREILEPMVEDKLNRLDSSIEKSEKTIYVNEEKEERELAKDAVDNGNFVEAFNRIATALKNLDDSKKNSYPLITLRFADMELKENVWNRAKVILKNTGKAHATGIKVELIGPVVVRRLKPISHLNAKEEKEVEIAVRFDGGGSVPVDVEMTYKSAVDGNEHETRDGLWIDVGPVAHKSEKSKDGSHGGGDRKGAPVIVPGKISRCKICLGVIKNVAQLYECGCGRKYHKSCITRVEECPSCSLPAQDL